MTILTSRDKELIEIVQEKTLTFSEACIALELNPEFDLIGCDFSFVDFSGSNLTGFNFSNANLRNATGENITGIEHAIFKGAKLTSSIFDTKEFYVPSDFLRHFYKSEEHFTTRIRDIFVDKYEMVLGTSDDIELVKSIITTFQKEPLVLCSALSLVSSDWKKFPERFDIFDSMIAHEYPAVCVEALKALEKCATLKEIAKRYRDILFGSKWRSVRYACFVSLEEDMSAEFKAGEPKSSDDWLDPVESIQEGKQTENGPYIYSQKVFEQGQLPSQNGYLSEEGGQFFNRIARKSNMLYRFDTPVSGLSVKRYFKRLNLSPTIDLYRRLFYMPSCFNLLNLVNPRVYLEDYYTNEFITKHTLIISTDNKQFELFDYLQSD